MYIYTMYISTVIVVMAILTVTIIPNVYAGGPRHDYVERYEDVPGGPECWTDGFDDGANDSYDEDRANECEDIGDQYNRAFDVGKVFCEENAEDKDCVDARNEG